MDQKQNDMFEKGSKDDQYSQKQGSMSTKGSQSKSDDISDEKRKNEGARDER